MYDYDKKMLEIIEILVLEKKAKSRGQIYDEMKILRQTITKIKKGINHFTPTHIEIICKKYNVNANWIFGIEKNIYNTRKPQ